jgi:glycosyltransferase involved in cell wall biosynthesis
MASFSAVTVCVRRWDFLFRSLPGWRALPGLKNLFVVTYAFDDIPPQGLEREHVVVVNGRPFHLTKARNTGARAAQQAGVDDYLLFIDADILVKDAPLLVKSLETEPDYVLDSPHAILDRRPGLEGADPEKAERGMRGTHFVRPCLFFRIYGYNQQLRGWGYEDLDLFNRYSRTSDRAAFFDRSALRHQAHSDQVRQQLQAEPLMETLKRNKGVAESVTDPVGRSWAADFGHAAFEIRPPRPGP